MNHILRLCLLSLLLLTPPLHAAPANLYQLSYSDLTNTPVSLAQYKGKVILLNFWATWCPPCIKEMPSMQRLKTQLADQPFEIVAINMGEDSQSVTDFLQQLETQLSFPVLLDPDNDSFKTFKVRGLPMTLLYDQEGNLVETIMGVREWDQPSAVAGIKALIRR
ncbi:TlpA disulfide reductase family protein [Neptuniibacter halophilus]|uniref:TlpA disulfide reductase family protein n=1 Tax=Neptuniibacter halophilus TaxID=651666 RepID=UPI0025740726|nr:TlpA disulfide reductase family protein [Neptuniibacter halophilus]